MSIEKPKEIVSVTEAAAILGVTVGRVRQLVGNEEEGKIPAFKINERAWAIKRSDLDAYRKTQKSA